MFVPSVTSSFTPVVDLTHIWLTSLFAFLSSLSHMSPLCCDFRVKLLHWCHCVEKHRGRLRPGSVFAGTRTGPVKPRSLVKLRKCIPITIPSQNSEAVFGKVHDKFCHIYHNNSHPSFGNVYGALCFNVKHCWTYVLCFFLQMEVFFLHHSLHGWTGMFGWCKYQNSFIAIPQWPKLLLA